MSEVLPPVFLRPEFYERGGPTHQHPGARTVQSRLTEVHDYFRAS